MTRDAKKEVAQREKDEATLKSLNGNRQKMRNFNAKSKKR